MRPDYSWTAFFFFNKLLCRKSFSLHQSYYSYNDLSKKYESARYKLTNHGNEASDELEILEVVRVDVGSRVDLKTVVIFTSVFKQAVHGVQNLMGQKEEPLPVRQDAALHHNRGD